MDEREIKKLQKNLNSITLKNCSGIKIGDILYYSLSVQDGWKDGLRSIIRMFLRIAAATSYEFQVKGEPKTVFLFSNSYREREDHLKAFKNVTALAENSVEMVCAKYKLNMKHLYYIFLPFFWNRQMKKIVPEFGIRMKLISTLFQAYMDYVSLYEKIKQNHWEINSLVVYCDVLPVDCYFVQRFNQEKKNTVTLQHGVYSAKIYPWLYLGSKSRYFLAQNSFFMRQAREVGYSGYAIPVGSPHYLGQKKYQKPEKFQSEVIGIFMDGMLATENNIRMLTLVQDFCKKTNRRVLLKYHPGNNPKELENYIDQSLTTAYGMEITVEEFGKMIDVAIISVSTVFMAMLKQWIPSFLYVRKNHDLMLYPDTEELKFTTEAGLREKLRNLNSESSVKKMSEIRDFLLEGEDNEENYRKAFKMIGIL